MFNVHQSEENPVLHPNKNQKWEEVAACNGCPIKKNGGVTILYRAISVPDKLLAPLTYQSVIGIADSTDGIHFKNRKTFITPERNWEQFGCEDPRVTKIGQNYYTFYTALSSPNFTKETIKVGLAVSKDLKTIDAKHLVTPFNAKAMALFPEKINGKFIAIVSVNTDNPPSNIAIATFDRESDMWDEDRWSKWYESLDEHIITLKRSDNDLTEVGAPPVKTKDGWLVIYSHIQNYYSANKSLFGIEAVLLDLKDPTKIIGRTPFPIIVPNEVYAKYGFVSNVAFPTGALVSGDELSIYYGAADTTTCLATVSLSRLLREMKPKTKVKVFKRYSSGPVLSPIPENAWESKNVFNPTAVDIDGIVRIVYRAQSDDNTSVFGYAESKNGLKIDYRHPDPIYVPREEFEMKKAGPNTTSGCEDPRITLVGNTIYMAYTAYDGVTPPTIAMTTISKKNFLKREFSEWSKPILITPRSVDDKDGALLPKKYKDGYLFIHRIEAAICGDYVKDLSFTPNEIDRCFMMIEPRSGMWDSSRVGISSTPMLTKDGWLMLYHGVSDDNTYRMGAVLLDKKNPTNIIGRSALPLFEPERDYEKVGEIPNVVFPCGSVIRNDTLFIYYGGADRWVGVATASLKQILADLKS